MGIIDFLPLVQNGSSLDLTYFTIQDKSSNLCLNLREISVCHIQIPAKFVAPSIDSPGYKGNGSLTTTKKYHNQNN